VQNKANSLQTPQCERHMTNSSSGNAYAFHRRYAILPFC